MESKFNNNIHINLMFPSITQDKRNTVQLPNLDYSPAARHIDLNINDTLNNAAMKPKLINIELNLNLCRFDNTKIEMVNQGPDKDICSNTECVKKFELSCKKYLRCNHKCYGVINDQCLPCLEIDCRNNKCKYEQNKDSNCSICYYDLLSTHPSLLLTCGHLIHYICLSKRLELKWTKDEINFNYLQCPVCSQNMKTTNKELNMIIEQGEKLRNSILNIGLKYFDSENHLTENKFINDYKGNKSEYILNEFSFFKCKRCDNPFFAGLKSCLEEDDYNNVESLNKKERICYDCFDFSKIKGITNCKIHKREQIIYKCRFCCNVASHFCWGTTHFCEDCHIRQLNGDYLTKIDRKNLPECNDTCPLNKSHPENGEEFGIGCSLCMEY